MPHRPSKSFDRPAWTDRFKAPSADVLRGGLDGNARQRFDALRKRLLELEGISEAVAWYGDCWHWSLEYRTRLAPEPLAIIIPSPEDLQLALPMDAEFARTLPMQRLKRAVRDGLELALEPYHSRWSIWSVNAIALIDDLQDVLEMKLKHLAKRAG
jgi:hypothetical protein